MASDLADVGGNAPPRPTPLSPDDVLTYLAYECEPLLARRDELLAALAQNITDIPDIGDDGELEAVSENYNMASTLLATAEKRRTEVKKPFRDAASAVDSFFRDLLAPLDRPMHTLQTRRNAYNARKAEAARTAAAAAARRAQEQAERAAAEAAAAMAADQRVVDAEAAIDRAARLARDAERAASLAAGRVADLSRSTAASGLTTSLKTTWVPEITDDAQVPLAYRPVDLRLVSADARRARKAPDGRPMIAIPGIRWVAQHDTRDYRR